MTSVKPWKRLSSHPLYDCRVFKVRADQFCSPRTGHAHDFYVLECGDWVNVIPLTDEGEVVLVRQHRFGIDALTLEIPGGLIDPGEGPMEAGRRELQEETGYVPREMQLLGVIHPNPAIQANRAHTFLALGCKPVADQRTDDTEEIEVVTVPLDQIDDLLRGGQISHALVATAFLHWKLKGMPVK